MSDALGMIETRGFAAAVEAADTMVKLGKVELVGYERLGGGYVTAIIRGEMAAVKAAIEAGAAVASKSGELVSSVTIPRPHSSVDALFPLGRQAGATQAAAPPAPREVAVERTPLAQRSLRTMGASPNPLTEN